MTKVPPLAKLQFPGNQVLQRFQGNVAGVLEPVQSALTEIQAAPPSQSILASFKATANIQPYTDFILIHNLGRTPAAIVACLSNVYGSIVVSQTANPRPAIQAILRCNLEIPGGATLIFLVM